MTTLRFLLGVAVAGTLPACSTSDTTGPTRGQSDPFTTIMLNATAAPVYVALGATAQTVTVADPSASTAWDLAFTSNPTISVNGGASGPGAVKAYCLCANSQLSLSAIEALTPGNGSAAFGAVTAASLPADSLFQADAASQAIDGWYSYDPTTHAVAAASNVWGIRLASTSGAYAKFHVKSIPLAGQSNAGPVTIEWAMQSSATGALGADKQLVVDLTAGSKVYLNLTTGVPSATPTAGWDIAMQGYAIYVNGGTSGSGNVGAVSLVPSSFYASYAAITQIPVGATGIPSSAFSTDGAGGAFRASEPYRYDGTTHQVWPTYDVYLVKKGSDVYKVQVTNYYSTAGVFGNITLRYAKISS